MSDVKDLNDAHQPTQKLVETERIEIPNGETYIEYDGAAIGYERENALVTVQIGIFKNPEHDGFNPNEPEFVFGVSHVAPDGSPVKGESNVPISAVLEASLALYMSTGKQLTENMTPDTRDGYNKQLALQLSTVHQSFMKAVDEYDDTTAWVNELRSKHGEDLTALRADARTYIAAAAADLGIDPEGEDFDIDGLLDSFLPETARVPENQES